MTSLDTKKVINASKIPTKWWHFFIAAFLVLVIFTLLILVSGEKVPAPASSLITSRDETSFYTQGESQISSNLSHSSHIDKTQSSESDDFVSASTSTSSKNSSATTSTSSKESTSTSSKGSNSTSSDAPVSSQPDANAPYLLSESNCTYAISGSETTLLSVSNVSASNVIIPDSLGGHPLTVIGTGALNGLNFITSITLPNSVKEIGLAAFRKCSALKSISIPAGVTVLHNSAFSDCRSLVNINLPSSLTSIGKNVFENCNSLIDIYFSGNEEQKGNISFGSGNDALFSANWHYNY